MDRREFVSRAMITGAAAYAATPPLSLFAESPTQRILDEDVIRQISAQHEKALKMLRDWISVPSIAAENLGFPQGAEYMANLAREAGFQNVELVPTSGKPGVFGTLDAGARTSLGIYFMYDVKQYDPAEWTSPPLEGRIVDKPGLGKAIVGRGATNQKGPQVALLAALHAYKAAGKRLPVNLVLVCEGEEEIGSPNFSQVITKPEIMAALRKCIGVIIPMGSQGTDGSVTVNLGAKGVVELELVSTGEKWGRGPKADIHSSLAAQVDSPAWHLVQALNTLIKPDGHTPAVEGFFNDVKPLSPALRMLAAWMPPRRSTRRAARSPHGSCAHC